MSPEKARVFVAEPDPDWQATIKAELKKAGHEVVLTASTLEEGLIATKQLGKLGVQVATICGQLRNRSEIFEILKNSDAESFDKELTADGRELLKAIRAAAPEVRTVGVSGTQNIGADVAVSKYDIEELGEVVTKL